MGGRIGPRRRAVAHARMASWLDRAERFRHPGRRLESFGLRTPDVDFAISVGKAENARDHAGPSRIPVHDHRLRELIMLDLGDRTSIYQPEQKARYSREHVGSEYVGWLCFQSVYDDLVQTSPDMFH